MPSLRATRFRVFNYRNIDDSGWIPIESVTNFVGRNESGKSALLKALHKFNPATPEPYQAQREFPRDRFTREFRDPKDWPVCEVEFAVDNALLEEFRKEGRYVQLPTHFSCTRYYDGRLTLDFTPQVIESAIPSEPLVRALDQLLTGVAALEVPKAEQPPTPKETPEVTQADLVAVKAKLKEWATRAKTEAEGVGSLKSKEGIALLSRVIEEAPKLSHPLASALIEQLAGAAKELMGLAQKASSLPKLRGLAAKRIPVFIYFEQYGILNSAIYLPQFLEQMQREPENPQVRTINAMFKHVQLTAQEIYELGRDVVAERKAQGQPVTGELIAEEMRKRELREVKLNSASLDITNKFSTWWHQRRHSIRYQADGPYFRIWVADDRRPGVEIELESRSKGFQWFFSFYLIFLVESEEGHKDAVLLLDEPGLDLHPTAQEELIYFFEDLAKSNQLLYTTHSPFLIDGEHLERVRPVQEDPTGHSQVSVGMWPDDRETIFPLQGGAGYAMVRNLFQGKKNVLVEGFSDYLYIEGLALILRALGRQTISEDIYITPCGGTKNVGYIASLFLGQRIRPVILFDTDDAARTRQEAMLKQLYAGKQTNFVLLGEVLGLKECEIEDVVGEDMILPEVSKLVGNEIVLTAADMAPAVVDRIKKAAVRQGISLPDGWKIEIARRLASRWAIQDPGTFPTDVLSRGELLMEAIMERFQDPEIQKP